MELQLSADLAEAIHIGVTHPEALEVEAHREVRLDGDQPLGETDLLGIL